MGLFYPYREKMDSDPSHTRNAAYAGLRSLSPSQNDISVLEGFADIGYLSDPHKGHSQSGQVFTMGKDRDILEVYRIDPSRYIFEQCRDYCSSRSGS